MDQANFFKTLIIIVAIWYFCKFAFRFFGPYLLKKAVTKAGENFQRRSQEYYNTNSNTYNSDFNSQEQATSYRNEFPREKKKVGEYIEFEEIN